MRAAGSLGHARPPSPADMTQQLSPARIVLGPLDANRLRQGQAAPIWPAGFGRVAFGRWPRQCGAGVGDRGFKMWLLAAVCVREPQTDWPSSAAGRQMGALDSLRAKNGRNDCLWQVRGERCKSGQKASLS